MSIATAQQAPRRRLSPRGRQLVIAAVVVVVIAVMALSTRYVPDGAAGTGGGPAAFDAESYGVEQFPKQQVAIADTAVDAETLAAAIEADPDAAAEEYGVSASGGASSIVPVTFTGVVGEVPASGYTPIEIEGVPDAITVGAQLGPAINGTDLRDATGEIELGDFENQIQFQDAGAALNDQLRAVLTDAGAPDLEGRTVQVTGVFRLVNPELWNVTPSDLQVQQ